MRNTILFVLLAAVCAVPYATSAAKNDVYSDLTVSQEGTFLGKNMSLMQKAGSNLFTRATWGTMFIRVTALTNKDTVITRKYGEPASVADLKEGDILDIEGKLASGEGTIMMVPTKIRIVSLDRADKSFSGSITTIDRNAFTLQILKERGATTTIQLSASTPIKKGARMIELSDVAVGDRVVAANGEYTYGTNTLKATDIEIHQDPSVFTPRNFQGSLVKVSGTVLPVSMTVNVSGKEYVVYANEKTAVLNTAKKPTNLSRFMPGDTVRLYGAIRKTNLGEIDAEVVRDLAF